MNLREIRTKNGLSQNEVAILLNIPVRTLRRYETNEEYGSVIKRNAFIDALERYFEINEEKGILSIDDIRLKVTKLFDEEYAGKIDFCYLFGSYAKGVAKENSDVDLYISSELTGLKFVGLIERIRQVLHKKIDLIRSSELNIQLSNEIMKDGIKIYG